MGKKIPADEVIVEAAKKDFGHLSEDLANATFLREVAVILRKLAHEKAASDPKLCDKILAFQEKHKLAGIAGSKRGNMEQEH